MSQQLVREHEASAAAALLSAAVVQSQVDLDVEVRERDTSVISACEVQDGSETQVPFQYTSADAESEAQSSMLTQETEYTRDTQSSVALAA